MRRILFVLLLAGCTGPSMAVDAGAPDAGRNDAGEVLDAGSLDAGIDAAAGEDAGAPDAGPGPIGIVSGTCGELDDDELLSASPFLFENAMDFPMGFDEDRDAARLSEGGREILRDGNAGGSSLYSELFAFEVLHRCEGAALLATETEVRYDVEGKITDILVEIDGHRVGVSVVRAIAFPFEDPYTVDQARTILESKLSDILESSANVSDEDRWVKQILSVIAYGPMHAESIAAAWATIDASIRADTILVVTVTNGDDAFIY